MHTGKEYEIPSPSYRSFSNWKPISSMNMDTCTDTYANVHIYTHTYTFSDFHYIQTLCVCIYVLMPVKVCGSLRTTSGVFCFDATFLRGQYHSLAWSCQWCKTGWTPTPRDALVFTLLALEVEARTTAPGSHNVASEDWISSLGLITHLQLWKYLTYLAEESKG